VGLGPKPQSQIPNPQSPLKKYFISFVLAINKKKKL